MVVPIWPVIELPAVFATANAELFATGAVKIIKSMGVTDSLCFGVESGDAATYRNAARAMLSETKEFRQALKRELETGVSLAKAKFNAVKKLDLPDLDEVAHGRHNEHLIRQRVHEFAEIRDLVVVAGDVAVHEIREARDHEHAEGGAARIGEIRIQDHKKYGDERHPRKGELIGSRHL